MSSRVGGGKRKHAMYSRAQRNPKAIARQGKFKKRLGDPDEDRYRRANGIPLAMPDPQGFHGEPMKRHARRSYVGHKQKGVDRGIINVINAPSNPKVQAPERTVKFGNKNVPLSRLVNDVGTIQTAYGVELCPGAWAAATAPVKGTAKNQRLKDSINIRSWVMRIKTNLTHCKRDGAATYDDLLNRQNNVRFIVLQILDDKAKVNATAAGTYTWSSFMADPLQPMSWFESQNRAVTSVDNKGHRYKIILDHSWPNVTRDHYEEITLGPHVQTYDSSDDANTSLPVVGRFIAFFVYRSDNLAANAYNYEVGATIDHRITYTDE